MHLCGERVTEWFITMKPFNKSERLFLELRLKKNEIQSISPTCSCLVSLFCDRSRKEWALPKMTVYSSLKV